jgi:hypothetical protein
MGTTEDLMRKLIAGLAIAAMTIIAIPAGASADQYGHHAGRAHYEHANYYHDHHHYNHRQWQHNHWRYY